MNEKREKLMIMANDDDDDNDQDDGDGQIKKKFGQCPKVHDVQQKKNMFVFGVCFCVGCV